ncbi:hypothetical protein M514_04094, partial [Trichuris suis]
MIFTDCCGSRHREGRLTHCSIGNPTLMCEVVLTAVGLPLDAIVCDDMQAYALVGSLVTLSERTNAHAKKALMPSLTEIGYPCRNGAYTCYNSGRSMIFASLVHTKQ